MQMNLLLNGSQIMIGKIFLLAVLGGSFIMSFVQGMFKMKKAKDESEYEFFVTVVTAMLCFLYMVSFFIIMLNYPEE